MKKHQLNQSENTTKTATSVSQNKDVGHNVAFEMVDDRPETFVQRKVQKLANDSPSIKQFRTYQEIADNSFRLERGTQIQMMADRYVSQRPLNSTNKVAQPQSKPTAERRKIKIPDHQKTISRTAVIQRGQCGMGSSVPLAGGGELRGPVRGRERPTGTGGIVLWSTILNEPVVLTNAHVVFGELPGHSDNSRMKSIGSRFTMDGVVLTVHAAIRRYSVYSRQEYGDQHDNPAKQALNVRFADGVNDAAILRVNARDREVAMEAIGMVGKRRIEQCGVPQDRSRGEISKKGQTTGRRTSGGYHKTRAGARGEYVSEDGRFADGGDSGSVVLDENNQLIGLLVAATRDGRGEFDAIQPVLDVFGLELRPVE